MNEIRNSIHFDNAKLEDIEKITEFAETELEKADFPIKKIMQINIVIDEIFSNIVRYAYDGSGGPADVELTVNDLQASLCFTDEGKEYNPLLKEDPDVTLSADERNIGGLGIYMVKQMMDDVSYEYKDGKNKLTVTEKR